VPLLSSDALGSREAVRPRGRGREQGRGVAGPGGEGEAEVEGPTDGCEGGKER
jgi:hypothetical protein